MMKKAAAWLRVGVLIVAVPAGVITVVILRRKKSKVSA